jgi:hypothetical protein
LSASAREARKKFLVLACACDRVELALIWKKHTRSSAVRPGSGTLATLFSNPWFNTAVGLIPALLPRKLRVASLLLRMWRARRA